jgi:hypothetical protein
MKVMEQYAQANPPSGHGGDVDGGSNDHIQHQQMLESSEERSEARRRCVELLHPPASELDFLSEDILRSASLYQTVTVDLGSVASVLKDLPVGSAKGFSGWTYLAIRAVFMTSSIS